MHLVAFLLMVVTASALQPGGSPDAAGEALARGDFAVAERLYRQASLASPDDVHALLGWAQALRQQGREQESSARLRAAADRWLRSDELQPAAEVLGFLAESSSRDAALLARLGDVLVRQRRFAAAEEPLDRAWSLRSDSRTALLLGSVVWENGDAQRAAELFRVVGEKADASGSMAVAACTQLGRLELWRSRPAAALTAFERARSLGGDGLELQMETARALAQLAEAEPGSMERALQAHRELVERLPENAPLRYRFARLLARAGQAERARVEMSRYRELDRAERDSTRTGGLTAARAAAARAHLAADEPALALEALSDEGTDVVELRSLALLRLGRFEEAQRELEEALQAEPTRTELRALLARALAGR